MTIQNSVRVEPSKTIIICSNVYPPNFVGGAELIAHYQAKELKRSGWKVIVFTGDTTPQPARHDMTHEVFDGLDVFRVHLVQEDFRNDYVNFSHPKVEQHFIRVLQLYPPHVVHFHNIIGLSIQIIALAKAAEARTLLTVHDHWGFCFKNTLMKTEELVCKNYSQCADCLSHIDDGENRRIPMRLRQDYFEIAMRNVDAFVSPSAYLAKVYISAGFPQEKFHVVWNGIDYKRFKSINRAPSEGVLRLSFFGYFGRHKGIRVLLEALSGLSDKSRIRLNLIGDGDQLDEYKRILAANGNENVVKFWGKIDNFEIERAYAETDVLVLPSIWRENQPVSITEAMAAGIPVLASNVGGIPELVENEVTGLLFEVGNIAQLTKSIERFMNDANLLSTLGQNASKRMALHDFGEQVGKLVLLYESGISAQPPAEVEERIVICIGKRFCPAADKAISSLKKIAGPLTLRFVHADWAENHHWQRAAYFLVVDEEASCISLLCVDLAERKVLIPSSHLALSDLVDDFSNATIYDSAENLMSILLNQTEMAVQHTAEN